MFTILTEVLLQTGPREVSPETLGHANLRVALCVL